MNRIIERGLIFMTEKLQAILRQCSFFKGILRVIDITGSIDRESIRKEIRFTSPGDAIEGDWLNVGNDLRIAMCRYKNETVTTK
jgi:hypothetical protein